MPVRRVVTGHTADGQAVFVSDEEVVPNRAAGPSQLFQIWSGDEAPTFPDDGSESPVSGYWPPIGGYRFLMMSIAPEGQTAADAPAGPTREPLLGIRSAFREGDLPGMHTSDTVDFEMVLSGQITLELDDGSVKTMGPGDAIIQNGTRHRWLNHGTEPANVAVILLGAHRQP